MGVFFSVMFFMIVLYLWVNGPVCFHVSQERRPDALFQTGGVFVQTFFWKLSRWQVSPSKPLNNIYLRHTWIWATTTFWQCLISDRQWNEEGVMVNLQHWSISACSSKPSTTPDQSSLWKNIIERLSWLSMFWVEIWGLVEHFYLSCFCVLETLCSS